jgi:rhodanese-related sulfurtransferase
METFENIEVAPGDVKVQLERGDRFLLVDVREQWEYDTARIEGSVLIPLREVPANLERLRAGGDIVFLCHHGMRSLDAAVWVRSQGIEAARSMTGGIERWSREVDPQVPRY